jgi:hypothetical protein
LGVGINEVNDMSNLRSINPFPLKLPLAAQTRPGVPTTDVGMMHACGLQRSPDMA